MKCPRCSAENRHDAIVCEACGAGLGQEATPREAFTAGVSLLAVLALVLGILSVLTFGRILILPVLAIVLGVAAICCIDSSGGRITGHGIAIVAITLSIVGLFLGLVPKILGPHPRSLAFRMVCGTNLSGLGKAMMIYANDYEDRLPRAGGIDSKWTGRIPDWTAQTRHEAFGLAPDGHGGQAGISASVYFLVKYTEVTPKSFMCDGDKNITEFKLGEYNLSRGTELIDVWDFGPEPMKHCSYAYHTPYSAYALTVSDEPGMAVMADGNPWQASYKAKGMAEWRSFVAEGTDKQVRQGNASCHEEEGQNVLFLDGHVEFAKRPTAAINDDNIYTSWNGGDIKKGTPPTIGSRPASKRDSLLVTDGQRTVRK